MLMEWPIGTAVVQAPVHHGWSKRIPINQKGINLTGKLASPTL
jgi:hypothetical protein